MDSYLYKQIIEKTDKTKDVKKASKGTSIIALRRHTIIAVNHCFSGLSKTPLLINI